jgi:hypothetical protein
MINNMRNGIDPQVNQQLTNFLYANNYYGASMVSDGKRYIYMISGYGQATFSRYDCWNALSGWTQLANCPVTPGSSAYQSDMAYDPTNNRIYAVFAGSADWRYYDINAGVWSAALTTLPNSAAAGAQIVHPRASEGAASDDYIYYFDGVNAAFGRYSISGNKWSTAETPVTTLTPVPLQPTYCARMYWGGASEPNKIYAFLGGARKTFYIYTIDPVTTNPGTWSPACNIIGTLGTIGAGSIGDYDNSLNEMFWVEAGTRNINKTKLQLKAEIKGTATSGTTTVLNDTSKDLNIDDYSGGQFYLTLLTGTGSVETRMIVSNTETSFNVWPAFSIAPAAGTTYEVKSCVLDYGLAVIGSGWSNSTLSTGKTMVSGQYIGQKVRIVAGTRAGDEVYITANAATGVITVSPNFGGNLDATSRYEIIGWKTFAEQQIPYGASASYYGNTMLVMQIKGVPYVYYSRKSTSQAEFFRFITNTP